MPERNRSDAKAELPRILASPSDTLSPRMLLIIEALAVDIRRLYELIEGLSSEIEELAKLYAGCERPTSRGVKPWYAGPCLLAAYDHGHAPAAPPNNIMNSRRLT